MIAMTRSTPDFLFDRIRKYNLDCDPVQNGWIQSAIDQKFFGDQIALAKDYEAFGGGLEVLTRNQIEQKGGIQGYVGGLFCPGAGSIQPLSYTRELARAAISVGAQVYTRSPADKLTPTGEG